MFQKSITIFLTLILSSSGQQWNAIFSPNETKVEMAGFISEPDIRVINVTIFGVTEDVLNPKLINDREFVKLHITKPRLIRINEDLSDFKEISREDGIWESQFSIYGMFFGNFIFRSKTDQF
jgi:hypothetical protein